MTWAGRKSILQQEYFPPGTPPANRPPIINKDQANSNPQLGIQCENGNVRILSYELSGAPCQLVSIKRER